MRLIFFLPEERKSSLWGCLYVCAHICTVCGKRDKGDDKGIDKRVCAMVQQSPRTLLITTSSSREEFSKRSLSSS